MGKKKWKIPGSFVDQFDIDEEVKQFLLNFRYILFDTNPWNFRDETNEELKNNVFLFTAMVLMKAAFKSDMETIREIFNFWYEKGFTQNKDSVMFFLAYISNTQEINREQLKRMLDESKIDGGELMQTLAQQLKKEGKKEGKKAEKLETAKRMLLDDFPIEKVIKYTGLTEKEVKALIN